MSDETLSDEPHDRLTHLCAEMVLPLDREENSDVRAIVFLSDASRGGIEFHGYDSSIEGTAELFIHMKAVFKANGKDLEIIGIPNSPAGLEEL